MLKHRDARGQVTLEVAVLFGLIVAGIVALSSYMLHGVQGYLKSNADSIGGQFQANTSFESHNWSQSAEDQAGTQSAQTSQSCQSLGGATDTDCTPLGLPALPNVSGGGTTP